MKKTKAICRGWMTRRRRGKFEIGVDEFPQVFRIKDDAKSVCAPGEIVARVEIREIRQQARHAVQGPERLRWCDELHALLAATPKHSSEWFFYEAMLHAVGGKVR